MDESWWPVPDVAGFLRTPVAGSGLGALVISQPNIDLLTYGIKSPLTTPDGALATAISANPGGGTLVFPDAPPATPIILNGTYDLTGVNWEIRGQGPKRTTLKRTVDTANAMFILWRPSDGGAGTSIKDIMVDGPGVAGANVNASNVGSAPVSVGVILRDGCTMENCEVKRFGTGVVIEGNHQGVRRSWIRNNKWNLAWAQGLAGYATAVPASGTHGDQDIDFVDLTGCGLASIYIDGNSKIDSSTFKKCHLGGGPICIQAAAKGAQEPAINNTSFRGCSFEYVGEFEIKDDGVGAGGTRRSWKGLRFYDQHDGPYQSSNSRTGTIGTRMVEVGRLIDWKIFGQVGDSSNAVFSAVHAATDTVFAAEEVNGLVFYDMDTLWGLLNTFTKPFIKLIGGAVSYKSVYGTVENTYTLMFMKNMIGTAPGLGNVMMPSNVGEPFGAGFTPWVTWGNNTRFPLGLAGGTMRTNGEYLAVVIRGPHGATITTATGVVAGSKLTADSASSGNVKLAGASDPVIGHATDVPSGGLVQMLVDSPFKPSI